MKPSTRLLALLLSLVLAFSLALPAFAEDDLPEEPNPAMPVITVQPQGDIRVRAGQKFTLKVEAYIPNGDDIGYAWRRIRTSGQSDYCESAAEITHTWGGSSGILYYTVEVFNLANPECRVVSETAQVEVYLTLADRIELVYGIILGAIFSLWGPILALLLFVTAPISVPLKLIQTLFERIVS